MASTKNRKLALYGLLTALALILSYVEGQIPAFFAVPGMKLGLTNIVVLLALYCMGAKSALAVNFVRIVLVSILFGNGVSFWYSLAGGLLSGAVMIALKKCGRFSVLAVSISGGIAHNKRLTDFIAAHVDFIAPVFVYPGENELEALARNALAVLRGDCEAKTYYKADVTA